MSEHKHTELPWKTSEEYNDCGGRYTAIDGKHYNDEVLGQSGLMGKEDAAFIVQACNGHYKQKELNAKLLEALRALEVAANTVVGCYSRNPANFAAALQKLDAQTDDAREAIKLAEFDDE